MTGHFPKSPRGGLPASDLEIARAECASDSERHATEGREGSTEADRFRTPRLLYYLGMLLLAGLVVRPIASLTMSDLLFLAALICVVLQPQTARPEGIGSLPSLLMYGVLMFAVGAAFSSLGSQQPLLSLAAGARFVYLTLVWFWLGAVLLRTASQIIVAILAWVIGVAVSGLAAAAQLLVSALFPVGFSGRLVGLTGHPNDLGGLTAVALVPAVMLLTRPAVRLAIRLPAMAIVGCSVTGLILSGSVGALLSAAAALFFWFASTLVGWGHLAQIKKRYLMLGFAVVAAVGFGLLSQPASSAYSPISRIPAVIGNESPQAATAVERLDIDRVAAAEIVSRPLLGSGLDEDTPFQELGGLVHNMLLGVWFGGGLPALIGVLMVLLSVALTARSIMRDARSNEDRLICLALTSSLLCFVAFGMSAPILYVRYGWVSAALLIALRAAQRRAAIEATASPTPANVVAIARE